MEPDNQLTESYLSMYPSEAARSLERLSVGITSQLLEALKHTSAANVLDQMLPDYAGECLSQMNPKKVIPILEVMTNSAIARILLSLDRRVAEHIISLLKMKDKVSVQLMFKYPANSVGTKMGTLRFYLMEDISVGAALRQVQKHRAPTGCELFIVDRHHQLTGVITAISLLRAENNLSLRQVMRLNPPSLNARSRIDLAVLHQAWQKYRVLPVIDHDGGLIGVINYETVVTASRQEQHKMEHVDPFSSVLDLAKLYWYSVAMLLEMLSGKRTNQNS